MAGVLDALASYLTNMLTEMAKDEVAMLIGVSSGIEDLDFKLKDLKNILADADRKNITDESVRGWVEELKRVMYNVTDILDLCQLKVMEQGPSKDMGCLNPLLFCMRNPLHAHDIGSRIKKLNQKLDDISKRGSSFNFINLEAYPDRKTTHPPLVDRKTDPLLERSGVVGTKIEEDTRALVDMLMKDVADESDELKIVAIVGVGGIGKTTLGKKVFNSEEIQSKFAKKIWLSITHEFNEVELLRTAIAAIEGDKFRLGGGVGEKSLLVPALANAIKDKKFFLVLDDMWGSSGWNNLLKAPFSHGAPGSRVLITTRHDTVARGMKAVHPYYHVDKLGPEDAWSLLKKQVLINQQSEHEIDMVKDIGLQIIAKCDGLPLAIKVMGGLLCHRDKERRDWEKVLNTIGSVSQMPEELNYAIYLSYEDLSPCLKQCFLHFSLKPKKTNLEREQFVGMWIGEGFVYGNSDRLEEIGIEHYRELILRNLIEPDTEYPGQYICHMHDVIRSFAQFVTRDEALVAHNGETINSKLSLPGFLRLSIETKGVESNEFEWRSLQEQKALRAIILIGNFKIQSGDSLDTFSSLRTLHVESANFAALVESLYLLKHLRYLTIAKCNDINSLPENIHNMKFLQHICLDGCENLVQLPKNIVMLRELRFLCLENTSVNSMPSGFRVLTNLRSLHGFRAHMDGDWCSLEELGPLFQLRDIELVGLENVSAASFATKARLSEKVHLSFMSLDCHIRLGNDGIDEGVSEKDQVIIEEVFHELCPPSSIEDIRFERYFGRQLPRWMTSTATAPLNSLRILMMEDLACCMQLPDGLCLLPCLQYLEVHRAPAIKHVGPEFVQPHSHRHHPSALAMAAFPRLHEMILDGMMEWEEWEWEEEAQAMPVLEELLIQNCKLRCIPPGLASHARALKKLCIYEAKCLHSLENFPSVVELDLLDNPNLRRISNFPKLQKLEIDLCRKLGSLEGITAVQRFELTVQYSKKRLPVYLQTVNPSHLLLDCSTEVLTTMAAGKFGHDWDKFSHIQHVEAYADHEDGDKRWHLSYTREPYKIETSIEPKLQDDDNEEDSEDDNEDDGEEDSQDDNEDDDEEDEEDVSEKDDEEDVSEEDEDEEGEEDEDA